MPVWQWALWAALAALILYLGIVVALIAVGRRSDARALAGFVPDCVVLFRRLLRDPRVPRSRKVMLAGLLAYLAMPLDLVPDFLPVIGQLDDAIIVVLVLRWVLRSGGQALLLEHWPGPASSRELIARLAYGPPREG